AASLEGFLIVVFFLIRALRQLYLVAMDVLIWNQTEKMRDAVQTRSPLVVRAHEIPRRLLRVSRVEHQGPGPRIGVPGGIGFGVHWAQFPLAHWVVDAPLKPPPLLILADFQPKLDQDNPGPNDMALELGAILKKLRVLVLGAITHDMFDA